MSGELEKVSDFVTLYREHKDLLSVYFKSEEEAADCERRAEMGDDRAMRIMSLAYDLRIGTPFEYWNVSPDNDNPYDDGGKIRVSSLKPGSPGWPSRGVLHTGHDYKRIDKQTRSQWHDKTLVAKNLDAVGFAESVSFGLRDVYTRHTEHWTSGDKDAVTGERFVVDDPVLGADTQLHVHAAGDLRYELAGGKFVSSDDFKQPSVFSITYPNESTWPSDNYYSKHNGRTYTRKNYEALEICAHAGSAKAARLLSRIHTQPMFYEYIEKHTYFGGKKYLNNNDANPAKDGNTTKAKEWERIADHLEGKTTPAERKKFLNEFLYSQAGTPEGLYNIGYALFHNEHIGDKARGLDYLKHAANLGDANAARELGEIHHTAFDATGDKHELQQAYLWYGVAAKTPMKVKDSKGTITEYDGHPNAKARIAYLDKAYPELQTVMLNENAIRNPSPEHVRQYPESVWHIAIPITDIHGILHDPKVSSIVKRMEASVAAINDHVQEFEVMTRGIEAKIAELSRRTALFDARVDTMNDDELKDIGHNERISAQQRDAQKKLELSRDRYRKETAANIGATILSGWMTGGASFFVEATRLIGHGVPNSPGVNAANLLRSNKIRAAGYHAVMKNEVDYQQAIIDELELSKKDVSRYGDDIRELAKTVQTLAEAGPMQRLRQDEVRSRAIVEGYLRQRILKSGLDVCRALDDHAKDNGAGSVDALLDSFKQEDARLHQALRNLCEGHADSNDMQVILTDANALKGNDLEPHHKALKEYVEHVVKGNIGYFMTRASQIDVIAELGLVDFKTMSVDHSKTSADLVRGAIPLSAEEHGTNQVDKATKLALTSMFARQFGVSHIGQYDVRRIFSFYLHRHGKNELIAAELQDGQVSDELAPKIVSSRTPREMRGYVERAKESARLGREDIPDVGDLFLRVCGYEYYLPQAVITSGRGNRFKENPEAPVAYAMANEVIHNFIEKMSLSDMANYRKAIGEELDGVIAQTFMDFFKEVGHQHAEKFAPEREYLRDALKNEHYGPRFDTYQRKITRDTIEQFPLFLKIYERNLAKELTVAPEDEAKIIQQQIASLDKAASEHLAPDVPAPGSHQAQLLARNNDHRGTNMTEGRRFTG